VLYLTFSTGIGSGMITAWPEVTPGTDSEMVTCCLRHELTNNLKKFASGNNRYKYGKASGGSMTSLEQS